MDSKCLIVVLTAAASGLSAPERDKKTKFRAPLSVMKVVRLRPRPPRQPTRRYAASEGKRTALADGWILNVVSAMLEKRAEGHPYKD